MKLNYTVHIYYEKHVAAVKNSNDKVTVHLSTCVASHNRTTVMSKTKNLKKHNPYFLF